MIILDNINITYNNKNLLNNVNMYCMSGDITVLQGPNGGGKSSIFKVITGENSNFEGNIIFDGLKSNINNYTEINEKLFGYLPQNNLLFEHLTCYENIELPFLKFGINLKIKEINYYLKYFNLENIITSYPHEISLGQKQLIAFIRTVLIESQYILLDEPTSALDLININKVKKIILELKKLEKTILIISHDNGFSDSISDKKYYISDGIIIKK